MRSASWDTYKQVARISLVMRIAPSEVKQMTNEEMEAFIEVYNEIQDEQKKAMKKG